MNLEDITRMAKEAGMQGMLTDVVCTHDELERFAQLVAAAENEACAKVCDGLQDVPATEPRHCAQDIRLRWQS